MGWPKKIIYLICGIIVYIVLLSTVTYRNMLLSPTRKQLVKLSEDMLMNGRQHVDGVECNGTGWGGKENDQTLIEQRNPTQDHLQSIFTKSRAFKYHPHAVLGDRWNEISESWNICLSTQTTVNLLFWVSKQAETWKGPISVSLYTPDVDYIIAVKMIQYMQECIPDLMDRVTFHMVYPKQLPPAYNQTYKVPQKEYDCMQIEAVNKELVKQIRTKALTTLLLQSPYPQNVMRNLARQGCDSEYCFTPDVDMISPPKISEQLNKFTARKEVTECKMCAFIIPTYEIHTNVTTNPMDKKELLDLIQEQLARSFHIVACIRNQANSRLQEWEQNDMQPNLEILYNITTWRRGWEPIYIAKASVVPPFDERFIGYGQTRNTQTYEMHMAGYSWHMLNNPFLCHRGFQPILTDRYSVRRMQIRNNRKKLKV